jgi:hypothetical protein
MKVKQAMMGAAITGTYSLLFEKKTESLHMNI